MSKRLPRTRYPGARPTRHHDDTKHLPEDFIARLARFNKVNPVDEITPPRKPRR